MPYPRAEVDAAIRGLAEAFKEAERMNEWSWIADKFYHENCVYTCPYAGAMPVIANGREEIRRTRYGRDMDRTDQAANCECVSTILRSQGTCR